MRKLIVAAVACVAVGVSGVAFARGGGSVKVRGGHDGGSAATATSGRPGVTANQPGNGGNGSVTVDGQTFVGNPQGQSGSSGSPSPVIAGQNANFLLGMDKGTTSKREACPGWMQTSGLDHCIRPQDQLRPADLRR